LLNRFIVFVRLHLWTGQGSEQAALLLQRKLETARRVRYVSKSVLCFTKYGS